MAVLGISAWGHHSSAALLHEGHVIAGIENQKLLRTDSPYLPEAAMRFCLSEEGIKSRDLESVSIATQPVYAWLRRSWIRAKLVMRTPLASAYHSANEFGNAAKALRDFKCLQTEFGSLRQINHLDHHLCHAASAFYQSPFERALIVVSDEDGDGNSGTIALGEQNGIRVLRRMQFPNSLAWIYSRITELIGFTPRKEEHKTQWFGLEGEPLFKDVFLRMLGDGHKPIPQLNRAYIARSLRRRLSFSDRFFKEVGLHRDGLFNEDVRKALARSLEEALAELITDTVSFFRSRFSVEPVCLAGGLFQNPVLVSSLELALGRDAVFVPPCPGNAGTAVGAAYLTWHKSRPRQAPLNFVSAYLGPKFSNQDIKDVLDNCKCRYSIQVTEDRMLKATAQLLHTGKILGWFQGKCEFGPRALGNRSVLASPWAPYVRENLNDYIKGREWFRPFAISVPEEESGRYFDYSGSCRFMNSLGRVRPNVSCLPPEFVLPGGRVRLHIVEQRSNPIFWKLLKKFGENAPAAMLVNTSFNLFGEPLVATPRDAVRSYFCSGLDGLVISNFILCKNGSVEKITATQLPAVVST